MALSDADSSFVEFEAGLAHLAGGRWAAAVGSLRVAFRREPNRLAVVRGLVTGLIQQGHAEEARRAMGAFVESNPMSAEGWRLAAQLEWKLSRYDAAMEMLTRGLKRLPHSQTLHRQTALFWGARGKLEASAEHAERVKGQGAMQHYLAAATEKPGTTPFAIPTAAEATAPAGDWFDRIAQEPKLLDGLLNSPGETSPADLKMLEAIEAKLSALLESQPYHADRQLGLARLQVKVDMLPAAMLSVQRALRANPGYVEAKRLRATILGRTGEFDAAIELLEGLIAGGLDWPDLHFQVAELQQRRGEAGAARSHLYSAIRLNPGFTRAKELLERCAA